MPRTYRWRSSRLLRGTFWERIDMGAFEVPYVPGETLLIIR